MKHLLKLSDLTREELFHILDVADTLKADRKAGYINNSLAGKSVALLFAKPSTRTRTSFEVGVYQMGGMSSYINAMAETQLMRGEPVKDTARTLGRYYDCIVVRTFKQSDVETMAEYSGVPVINGLTDYCHPCQVLADLMTLREYKSSFEGLKAAFVGDGNNMANSLIVGCLLAGMQVSCATPKNFEPAADVLKYAEAFGDKFTLTHDPKEAVAGADVVYTDSWIGMGADNGDESRKKAFKGFQVNHELLAEAKADCMVQHCLPARRGNEIAANVFEEHAAEIFDEAENRLHVEKAVLAILLGEK